MKELIDKESSIKLIGSRVISARYKAELTGIEAANKLKIQKSAMSHIETGKNYPNLQNFIKMCILFKVSPMYLLGFTDVYTPLIEQELDNLSRKLKSKIKKSTGAKMGADDNKS